MKKQMDGRGKSTQIALEKLLIECMIAITVSTQVIPLPEITDAIPLS
jgi:hypothetical protein